MKERVLKVISQMMNVAFGEVNEDSSPENIARWDSIQHMNLMLSLEEEFKVKFTDEEIVRMVDVRTILEVMGGKA